MDGTLLRCYLHENQRHHSGRAWEALLAHANEIGIRGGSAFRAMAGFGRHHVVHDGPGLFAIDVMQTVVLEFLVMDDEARHLLGWAQQEGIGMFHARVPSRLGITGPPVSGTTAPGASVSGAPPSL